MMIDGYGREEDHCFDWVTALTSKVNVRLITARKTALDFLKGDNRHVPILLADGVLARKEEDELRQALVKFVQKGGVTILAGKLPHRATQDDLDRLFLGFDLPWRRGDRLRDSFVPNIDSSHIPAFGDFDDGYKQKARQLRHVDLDDAVQLPNTETVPELEDIEQVPAAFGRCGDGWVGYIGDLDGEIQTIPVLLFMCGTAESDSVAGTLCDCLPLTI